MHACVVLAYFGKQRIAISKATGGQNSVGMVLVAAALSYYCKFLFSELVDCIPVGSSSFASKCKKGQNIHLFIPP